MELLDGKGLANQLKAELAEKVKALLAAGGRAPHLAAVLVGDNPASLSYVRNKVRSCEQSGFRSTLIQKDASVTEAELIEIIKGLNNDPEIDGFIVQLPLPRHINADNITLAIDPKKDVDGFHPVNFGRMAQGLSAYLPATPFGIMKMLERYNISTSGKHCVVLGRSNIVGTPISILMSRRGEPGNATVTLCHSRTKNLEEYTQKADILIVALGIPNFIKPEMIKEGVVIIDVGINRVEDASRKRGYRLVGDVDFENVASRCSYITPVPGGVGPMTVAALLLNTMESYQGKIYSGAS